MTRQNNTPAGCSQIVVATCILPEPDTEGVLGYLLGARRINLRRQRLTIRGRERSGFEARHDGYSQRVGDDAALIGEMPLAREVVRRGVAVFEVVGGFFVFDHVVQRLIDFLARLVRGLQIGRNGVGC